VEPGVFFAGRRELRRGIEALDASALIATQPGRLGSDHPGARTRRAAVMASMCQGSVADPVSTSYGGPAFAALPSFAELRHCADPHTQAELTTEAAEKPERADATQRLDVL